MNTLITLILCITLLHSEAASDISFTYGFIGQLQSNPDSLIELSDSSVIYTKDNIKINVGYTNNTIFYSIYVDSEGTFMLTYPEDFSDISNNQNQPDTLYKTVLRGGLIDPPGYETFYLINSSTPLTELTNLIGRYDKAPEKGKLKLTNRIQAHINALDPNIKGELAFIPNRLDKPMVGGVAFRGDDEDHLKDGSLTHVCTGSGGIAFQKIVLNHR